MTRTHSIRVALFGLFLLPVAALGADRVALLPAQAGDQVAERLVVAKRVAKPELDRTPVALAWALDPAAALVKQTPFVAESREFWRDVGAAELARGVHLHLTAPGAVLRLSAQAHSKQGRIDPAALVLRQGGREFRGGAAFDQIADAAALKAAGLGFPERSAVVRLRTELGAGDFELALEGAKAGALLHVFEPDSSEVLSLRTGRDTVLQDGTLEVFGTLQSGSGRSAGQLVGTVVAPNGRLFDLTFAPQAAGEWKASARIDASAGAGAGLWEVHTTLHGADGRLQRDARTAFAASEPTARFGGTASVQAKRGDALRVSLPVEVATGSRYDASAVLYARAANGAMAPIAIAHSAAWLDPGLGRLDLTFDSTLLAKSGYGAPYEVRELRLVDQGSLGVMEHRARALRLD